MLAKTKQSRRTPQISDAEWTVMKVLWDRSPLASKDVIDALSGSTHWKPKTIHTLLARLVRKGALIARKEGREYQFKPAFKAEDCQRTESRSFLERVFDGDVAPFLACFVRDNKLSRAEIEELKCILEGKV
jgi:BlaI family transcriptional regulator, penicillinase repressor